ncbi:hypothetical protein LCGC14_2507690, partial [marine sediment metagenome]
MPTIDELTEAVIRLDNENKKLRASMAKLSRRVRANDLLNPIVALSRDLVDLGEVPSIRLRQNTQQSLSNNVSTKISLQVTDWDTMGGADLGNNEIIIRRSALYLLVVCVRFVANTTGGRQVGWRINNTGDIHLRQEFVPGSNTSRPSACEIIDAKVGDTVQLYAGQNSGGNLATLPLDVKIGIPSLSL